MKGVLKRDFIAAVIFLLFLSILWAGSMNLPEDVKTFPLVIMGVMAVNLIIMIAKALTKKESDAAAAEPFFNRDFVVIGLSLLCYYFLFTILGFYVTSALLIMFLYIYLMKQLSVSALVKGACFSLSLTAILYVLFSIFLNLVTPRGFLF